MRWGRYGYTVIDERSKTFGRIKNFEHAQNFFLGPMFEQKRCETFAKRYISSIKLFSSLRYRSACIWRSFINVDIWSRAWILRRRQFGLYDQLMVELRREDLYCHDNRFSACSTGCHSHETIQPIHPPRPDPLFCNLCEASWLLLENRIESEASSPLQENWIDLEVLLYH